VLKRPRRALLALGLEGVLGESGSQSRKPPLLPIASDGGGAVLTAERPGLFDIVVLFPLVSLPAAVAPPHTHPPPSLLCIKRPRLLAAAVAWPFDLGDDSASVVVSKRLSAVW
jgi:hypothetical protein